MKNSPQVIAQAAETAQDSRRSRTITPVTIVTGFLGSGKTTLINYVLEEVGGVEKLAIIKNEIGDVAVDSKVIKGKNIVMKELLNGCVCCTLVGELEDSLKELVDTVKPDRIIIEASGAANPAILGVNIDRLDFVRRDLIITVIDVLNFEGYKDKSIVARMQEKFTDLIVLNRVGEVDEDTIDRVLDDVYEIRPGVSVVRTATGRVDPDILFGVLSGGTEAGKERISLSNLEGPGKGLGSEGHDSSAGEDPHRHHLHEDEIETFSYRSEKVMKKDCLEKVLDGLSEEYYRVKGFVWFESGRFLLNFVCGRYEFDTLEEGRSSDGQAVESTPMKKQNPQNEVVFIGKRIKKYGEKVLERVKSCEV